MCLTHSHGLGLRTAVLAGILSFLGLEENKEKDPLIHTIKLGILNLQREQYKKAESILHVALRIAQERMDPEAETYIFDILANVAFEKGEHSKAEKLFVDVMQRTIAAGTPRDDNSIVEMSLKLAQIYSMRKDSEKAEQGFRFCIDTQQKKLEGINYLDSLLSLTPHQTDTLVLWARSKECYGRHHLDCGRYDEAKKCLDDALKVSERVNGSSHDVTLSLLNDIGTVLSLMEDYDTAATVFKEAISRGQSAKSSELPVFYCNLGGVLLQGRRSHKEAEQACQEALKIAKRINHKIAAEKSQECLDELKKQAASANVG